MKKLIISLPVIFLSFAFMGMQLQGKTEKQSEQPTANKKILIAYFSLTGSTREIALQIEKKTGGDLFEIQPEKPYPQDYDTVVAQAKKELKADYRPPLKKKVENIRSYDTVFIGYPNWWGTYPMAVKTFLLENDLTGKTLIPFCTHLGSGLGYSVKDMKKLYPKATILEGLSIWGKSVKTAQKEVSDWLQKNKITK